MEVGPGEKFALLETNTPGCIKHIWITIGGEDAYPRRVVLRAWWDGETNPSIEAPIGDFFGLGHGLRRNFISLPLQMSPEDGRSYNSWWPMPFRSCFLEVHNECEHKISVYFYVDYEEYSDAASVDTLARFHAQWNREAATDGWLTERLEGDNVFPIWDAHPNLTSRNNYTILEAEGDGVYVGCNLNIDCFHRQGNDWYGEGDDMIEIDGEPWPPRLHGTGTEDYFCTAFGPTQEYCAPYHGIIVNSGNKEWHWKGKNSMYRYHIEDPIRFRKSIRVSIEHGEANALTNDYSSTAYWYQLEPHREFPALLPVQQRLPRPNEPSFPPEPRS